MFFHNEKHPFFQQKIGDDKLARTMYNYVREEKSALQGDMTMATLEYTKMQLKVISGEIPIERASGRLLYPLYKKAITNGDEELAKKVKAQLEVLRMESVEKNRQRSRDNYSSRVRSEFQWKQPKSNDYSDHHRKIIRG